MSPNCSLKWYNITLSVRTRHSRFPTLSLCYFLIYSAQTRTTRSQITGFKNNRTASENCLKPHNPAIEHPPPPGGGEGRQAGSSWENVQEDSRQLTELPDKTDCFPV